MDYKELIENMRAWCEEYIVPACGDGHLKCERFCLPDKDCLVTQAAAISTLQTENEKLREELERMKKIMRDNGIMVIPSKYPGGRSEWNIPKLRS